MYNNYYGQQYPYYNQQPQQPQQQPQANMNYMPLYFVSSEEDVKKASSMGVRFHDFDEMEFYVTYLMLLSDFKQIANDPHHYIVLAKEWLEDDDVQRRGSEKLCAYLYSIVLGKDDDD